MNALLGNLGTLSEVILAGICYYLVLKATLCEIYGRVVVLSLGMFLTFAAICRTLTYYGYFDPTEVFVINGLASGVPVVFLIVMYVQDEIFKKNHDQSRRKDII